MTRHRLSLPIVLTLSVVGMACTGSSGPLIFSPSESPPDLPWGLEAVALPADFESVSDTFAAFPDQVGSLKRVKGFCASLLCENSSCIGALERCFSDRPPKTGEFVTGADEVRAFTVRLSGEVESPSEYPCREDEHCLTARDYVRRHGPGGPLDNPRERAFNRLEEIDADPTDGLVWVARRPGPKGVWYTLAWGDPESMWIFEVMARTAMRREALVKAFVYAVQNR